MFKVKRRFAFPDISPAIGRRSQSQPARKHNFDNAKERIKRKLDSMSDIDLAIYLHLHNLNSSDRALFAEAKPFLKTCINEIDSTKFSNSAQLLSFSIFNKLPVNQCLDHFIKVHYAVPSFPINRLRSIMRIQSSP